MDIYSILFTLQNNKSKVKEYLDDSFMLPIELIDNKINISENIINDLELKKLKNCKLENKDNSQNELTYNNLYYCLLNPNNIFEKNIIHKWSNYYTNDKIFLNDTQDLLISFKPNINFDLNKCEDQHEESKEAQIYNSCEDVFYDNGFCENYQYIDLPYFNKYNNNETCMTMLSVYNLCSPALSLLLPILSLLLPFFIIKLQGYEVTMIHILLI